MPARDRAVSRGFLGAWCAAHHRLSGALCIGYDARLTMRLLLTWSDRSSLDSSRSHRVTRGAADRGPLVRLLEQKESRRAYDAAWVLTTPPHEAATHELA